MNDANPPPEFSLAVRLLRALGIGRGVFKSAAAGPRPEQLLVLYSSEGCPMCRRVRRTLTELDLDYIHRSCPRGDSPNRTELVRRGGKMQVPYLIDPNAGVELYESKDIVRYLRQTYGDALSTVGPALTSPCA